MNCATVIKITTRVIRYKGPESLGFVRYMMLPNGVRKNLGIAHLLEGKELSTFTDRVSGFFGGMTDDEYRSWVISN